MNQTKLLLIRLGNTNEAEDSPDLLFSATDLSRFYFPGRGVIPSSIVHIMVILGIFFFPALRLFLTPVPPPDKVVFIDLRAPKTVMYLPPLQGSTPMAPDPETENTTGEDDPAPAAATEGLSYPGVQPILSDPPDATNSIQTIKQPKIEDPDQLIPPLPIPNILETEETSMVMQSLQESTQEVEPPPEPEMIIPELEAPAMEHLMSDVLTQPVDNTPDALIEPSREYPERRIPDLVLPEAEPELILPESETAPIDRMTPPIPEIPASEPVEERYESPGNFPKIKLPDLMRRKTEPELVLPEPETAPIDRMEPSNPTNPADETEPVREIDESPGNFPKVKLPNLIRTEPAQELILPTYKAAPIERMRPSNPDFPASEPVNERYESPGNFPKIDIPGQVRPEPEDGAEMALPESQSAPIERIRPSSLDIPSGEPVTPSESLPGEERFLNLTPLAPLQLLEIEIPEGEATGEFAISDEPNLATDSQNTSISPKHIQDRIEAGSETPYNKTQGIGINAVSEALGTSESESNEGSDVPDGEEEDYDFIIGPVQGPGENAFEGITIRKDNSEPNDDNSDFIIMNPGENPIDGIEIINGTYEPGDAQSLPPVKRAPNPLQKNYPIVIISTENSSPTLPSYKFFDKNQIYTVYIDLREDSLEQDPSWILQFGLVEDNEDSPVLSLDTQTVKWSNYPYRTARIPLSARNCSIRCPPGPSGRPASIESLLQSKS
ncbi:MAG: hypothetical protein P8Z37_02405 [Acidobacteriota bacterium]